MPGRQYLSVRVSTTKALAAAGNYAAEDVLSEDADNGEGTAWTFNDCATNKGGSGYIVGAIASLETTALTQRITLYLFNATPTSELDDNAANTAVLNADIGKYVGRIDFPALEDLGGNSEAVVTPSTSGNLPLKFVCASTDNNLYGIAVTRDAITGENATDDLTIILLIEQDL